MLKKNLPFLSALTSSTIFAFVFFFIIRASSAIGNDPLKLLTFRLTIAALIMTALWKFGVIKLNFGGKKWGILALSGLMSPLLNFSVETIGVQYAPSSQFAVMYAASPIFITLLGVIFLKEIPKTKQVFYMLLSIAGIMLINFSPDLSLSPLAILFPFLAMMTGAINALLIKKAGALGFTPFEVLYFTTVEAAFVFSTLSIGQHAAKGTLSTYFHGVLSTDFIISILYLSVAASVIGFSLALYNMTRLPLVVMSSFSGLSTVMTIGIGVFFLNESFGARQIVGTLLIMTGVMLMNLSYVKSQEQ